MKRILIVRSNPIAPDPRVEKIAAALSRGGYSVSVLGWDRTGALPHREERQEYTVERLAIKAEYGRGMGNLPQLLRWQAGLIGWLLRHRLAFDFIHACDFDTILPALLCRGLFGKKVIYDIFDFYADHLRNTPPLVKKVIRAVDYGAINRADGVILVDESRRQQIAGSRPRRLEVIYNSPEDWRSQPLPGKVDDEVSLRVAYVGLLQVERGLLEMIEVFRRHPDWHLDLAGFGGDEQKIYAQTAGMANIAWHGRIPYQQALALSQAADVLFATYDPAIPNHRYSSPNKLFEAMMLGKPVIVSSQTNIDAIVLKEECGLVVPYGNIDQLDASLSVLAQNRELRQQLGKNARRAYESCYSWSQMSERLLRLYRTIA